VQFAIGSLLYCMTRGHEPYWRPEDPDPRISDLFRKGIFPEVNSMGDALDSIIDGCWNTRYATVKDLAEATTHLPGAADMGGATTFSAEYCARSGTSVVDL
jgi:atypical protein kinase C zeta type